MEYPGDLAVRLANEFQEKWLSTLDEDALSQLDEATNDRVEKRRLLFTRMDFHWRAADREMLEQIRTSAKLTLTELYEPAQKIMDEFYAMMRVPMVTEDGVAILDSDRRQMWKRDEHGNFLEDINQIDGQDIEKAILDIQRVRFVVSSLHAQLLSDAILARHLYDDRHAEGYESLVEGTQGDRNAKASRVSRSDKYKAFFHWHLYQMSNVFLQELNSFVRLLDRMVERRAWAGSRRNS